MLSHTVDNYFEAPGELACAENRVPDEITAHLFRVNSGDRSAFDDLIPLIYQELHRIAEAYLRREWQNRKLPPTALVHEAYLRIVQSNGAEYQNRKHFFVMAARVMRRILVDRARARDAAKRGAGLTVTLDPGSDFAREGDRTVSALHDALDVLAREDETKARLIEMRFFGGMTPEEISECVSMPVPIVRRELRIAQAWLRRQIEG